MRQKVNKIAFLVLVLGVFSCSSFEDKYLSFPLSSSTAIPDQSFPVIPVKVLEFDNPLADFQISDSAIVIYAGIGDYNFTVCNINSGDTLVRLCRLGRGGGETMALSSYYDIVDGIAGVVEPARSKFYQIDISESIRNGQTIFDRDVVLQTDSPIFYNTRMVGKDSLLCYDAKFNIYKRFYDGIPGFSLFDLNDGSLIDEYGIGGDVSVKLKKKSPLSLGILFRSDDCLIPERHCLCLAFYFFPAVAFLDYESGTITGVKIDKVPEFDQMKGINYFSGAEYSDGSIYLLYSGVSLSNKLYDGFSSEIHSKILKMDLSGKIEQCYELDDIYDSLECEHGRFYLSKPSDNYLYTVDFKSVN